MDAEGAFLRVEAPAKNPEEGTGEDSRPGAETGSETEEGEALWRRPVLRMRTLRGRYVS